MGSEKVSIYSYFLHNLQTVYMYVYLLVLHVLALNENLISKYILNMMQSIHTVYRRFQSTKYAKKILLERVYMV